MFGRLLGWYTIYTFWGLLPPNGILEGAKFTLCPSLAFYCILAALLHGTPAVCQPNFASGTTKGIRELTSPTLGRAAIRLGIDPFDDILVVLS